MALQEAEVTARANGEGRIAAIGHGLAELEDRDTILAAVLAPEASSSFSLPVKGDEDGEERGKLRPTTLGRLRERYTGTVDGLVEGYVARRLCLDWSGAASDPADLGRRELPCATTGTWRRGRRRYARPNGSRRSQ